MSEQKDGRNPFTRTVKVRAVLLADREDYVIFGASNNTDEESYQHLVCGEWSEDVINDAAVIVEFEVQISTRPMAIVAVDRTMIEPLA